MKILIIDDERSCRTLTSRFFSRDGYTAEAAEDGEEGINKALTFRPDLILLDYSLPDITGEAVLDRLALSDRTREIPVIMITGHTFTGEELAHLEQKTNLKLVRQKPANFSDILKETKKILSANTDVYH